MNTTIFLPCASAARLGVKGPRAAQWLSAQGIAPPSQPNTWSQTDSADPGDAALLVARLGVGEFFLEESRGSRRDVSNVAGPAGHVSEGSAMPKLFAALRTAQSGVYPVLREDAGFLLSGDGAVDVLAQVCNVNFAQIPMSARPVVMTLMIGVSVLIVPQSVNDEWRFRIWCDPTFALYIGDSIGTVVADVCGSQRREST